jgi:hypothetical protein
MAMGAGGHLRIRDRELKDNYFFSDLHGVFMYVKESFFLFFAQFGGERLYLLAGFSSRCTPCAMLCCAVQLSIWGYSLLDVYL